MMKLLNRTLKTQQRKEHELDIKLSRSVNIQEIAKRKADAKPQEEEPAKQKKAKVTGGGASNWEKFRQEESLKPQDPSAHRKSAKADKKAKSGVVSQFSVDENASGGLTATVAVDCEMVQCEENQSRLARVSIVNQHGHVLLDQFVRPTQRITNYLTWVSGITFTKIKDAPVFALVKDKVHDILRGRTIVGHSVASDLQQLQYTPPEGQTVVDIAKYKVLKNEIGKTQSLKNMALKFLNVDFQNGEHDSVEDARAALFLYKKFQQQIQQEAKQQAKKRKDSYNSIKSKLLTDIGAKKQN